MPTNKPQEEEWRFSGFDVPEQNWFRLPNNWTDLTARMKTWAEHKLVEYVLRHTWGYQEYGILKKITLDEFMNGRKRSDGTRIDNGVGMGKKAIIDGIRLAVEEGFLVEYVDDRDKGRVKKYYGLRMKGSMETPQGFDHRTPDVRQSHPRGTTKTHRTEKDTLERHPKKEKTTTVSGEPEAKESVVALTEKGISQKVAQRLVSRYKKARILEKIDFLEFLQVQKSDQIKKSPQGWLRRAIEDDYSAPAGYTPDWKEKQAAEARAREQAEQDLIEAEATRAAEKAEKQAQATKTRQEQLKPLLVQYKTSERETKIWSETLSQIKVRDEAGYRTFLADSVLLELANNQATLWLPSKFAKDQVEKRYKLMISQLLAKHQSISVKDINLVLLVPGE